jgi:hypothetical protein
MAAKRLFGIVVPLVLLASSMWAQVNELSVTAGRTFVSTQTIQNPPTGDLYPQIHFANDKSIAFNYGRFLVQRGIFGITAELPVAMYFHMDLNTGADLIPKDIGALFVTPSVRVNAFARDSVTPWASFGGGYGRFRQSSSLNYYGPNPGPTGSNTGVVQFGAGLDVWFWERWGGRLEARDFFSGEPDLNVETNRTRQHNYYVGVGVMHRF